jgi:hypothetical protein
MRAMIGNAAAGAAAGPSSTIVDTHLRNAQTILYWTHDWAHLRFRFTDSLGASQTMLDYPSGSFHGTTYECNPDRVKWVSVLRGGVWSPPLPKGISAVDYTYQENESWPQKWEPKMQMEFWPQTDQAYDVAVFGVAAMPALTADNDRFCIDDTLVSIIGTATLKAHYRQPDAAVAKAAADDLLIKLKGKSWGKDSFRPNDYHETEPLVRPQVV